MAIAFAQVTLHSRSKGHSAVAGAAYRAGVLLQDERTGETHHFAHRTDVIYQSILLPEGADEKFSNREYLWNEVERCEKRQDAQIAKDIVLALPKELDPAAWIDLTKQFAADHFVSKGLVADMAIHQSQKENPHAHIYVTTRRLCGDHFDRYKARDLNPIFAKGLVVEKDFMGEKWRVCQNNYFLEKGIELRVDQNQVIPGRHEGKNKGEHYLKADNRLRKAASVEIALNDPLSLLNFLSKKQAVFSDRDMERLVFKNTDTPEQFQFVLARLKGAKDLIELGVGEDGRLRYTTRATYRLESKLADDAHQLFLGQTNETISPRRIEKMSTQFSLTTEQTRGLYHLTDSNKIAILVGRAGSGKTYLMKPAYALWKQNGLNVIGLSVAGIAAKGLEAEAQIPSMTIASFKKRLERGSLSLSAKEVLVLDEAGMVDLRDMALIVKLAKQSGAKLILMGDHDQLQPIGPGAPFRALLERIGFGELSQIMRQKKEGDRQASMALSKGHIDHALTYYDQQGKINLLEDSDQALSQLIQDWQQDLSLETLSERIIIAHQNVEVDKANEAARAILVEKGILSAESKIQTAYGDLALTSGDQILCRQNNHTLGLHNGDFAEVLSVKGAQITVKLRRTQKQVTFNAKEYNTFSYGYAATVHKTQGATFNDVYVLLGSKWWNRHLTYVALTRHRNHVLIYADKTHYTDKDELTKTLGRFSFVDAVLDFPLSFAIRRGFDPEKLLGRFIERIGQLKETIHHKWLFLSNYEAYLQQQDHAKTQEFSQQQRQDAVRVAQFVDLYRELGKKWSEIYKGHKKHPDYKSAYQAMLLKNELAFEINNDLSKYQKALLANNISEDVIKKAAQKHSFALEKQPVKSPIKQIDRVANMDWFDKKYEKDWQKLRAVPNDKIKWLVKFYDLGLQKIQSSQPTQSVKEGLLQSIRSLSPEALTLIQRHSSQLAHAFKSELEFGRDKQRGRDR